ncbi:MAG: hypothetical protein ACXWRE_06880 [Pseudobdellovibrionaceae bacterium]
MKKSSSISLIAFIFLTLNLGSLANATNGVVYENGNGVGYINQGDSVQFKILGNYFKDPYNTYQDITTIKLSVAKDMLSINEAKLYSGLSILSNFMGSTTTRYYDRTSGLIGLRQAVSKNLQIEIYTEAIGYSNSKTYNLKTDSLSLNPANSGWSFFRNGGFALSFLFN